MKLDLKRLATALLLVIIILGGAALFITLTILTKGWFMLIALVIGAIWYVYTQLDDF